MKGTNKMSNKRELLDGARLKFPFYGNMFELFARKSAGDKGF
jgi:hypothetical protein